MPSIITLTTDFGSSNIYVASLKGVILSINPRVNIVDICHCIKLGNIAEGAFLIATAYPHFPKGTIHVIVIDPGVGSERKLVILKTPLAFFLAPDNGVLGYIINDLCPPSSPISPNLKQRKLDKQIEAIAITNPRFWRQSVSTTFHGRDILAPVAAHLSLDTPINEFGSKITSLNIFPIPQPHFDAQGNLIGQIIHIDHFGNLITNVKGANLPEKEITFNIGAQSIPNLSHFYAQGKGLMAIIGSSGHLEISLKDGNACTFLNAAVGDEVKIKYK